VRLIAIVHYPFLNTAFLTTLALTLIMFKLVFVYAKRRPVGTPLTWGEAVFAATYVFALMFLAYGIVPHHWLNHADSELQWRADKVLVGVGGFLKAKNRGGWMPFTITYLAIRDAIAAGIYIVFLGVQMKAWVAWQNRGEKAKKSTELATSTFGRPLVKKG
jgi:hypothetical protein